MSLNLDAAIKLTANVSGVSGINQTKTALQQLAGGSELTNRQLLGLELTTKKFAAANSNSISGIRNSISALRGLRDQHEINSKSFQRLTRDIEAYEKRLKSATLQTSAAKEAATMQTSAAKVAPPAFEGLGAGIASSLATGGGLQSGVGAAGGALAAAGGPGGIAAAAALTAGAATIGAGIGNARDIAAQGRAISTLSADSEALTKTIRDLVREQGFLTSEAEAGAAAYEILSSGFSKTADVTAILEASTRGAVGGFSDIKTVADATTSILNGYGKGAEYAAQVIDMMIQTQNDGKIVVGQYAQSIGRLVPTAAAAGIGLDELNAGISALTAQGVPAESTFAGLNQTIKSILKPTDEARNLAEALGLEFNASALAAKGLGGFLQDVQEKTKGNSNALSILFSDIDGFKAVVALTNDQLSRYNGFLENQRIKTGQSADAAEKAIDPLTQFNNAWKTLSATIGREFLPGITEAIKATTGLINLLTSGEAKEAFDRINGLNPFRANAVKNINAAGDILQTETLRRQAGGKAPSADTLRQIENDAAAMAQTRQPKDPFKRNEEFQKLKEQGIRDYLRRQAAAAAEKDRPAAPADLPGTQIKPPPRVEDPGVTEQVNQVLNGGEKANTEADKAAREAEQLAKRAAEIAAQTAKASADLERSLMEANAKVRQNLDATTNRLAMDAIRKRYEYEEQLINKQQDLWVNSVVGAERTARGQIAGFFRDIRANESGVRDAAEQQVQREQQLNAARENERVAQRSAAMERASGQAYAAAQAAIGQMGGGTGGGGAFNSDQIRRATTEAARFTGVADMCSESVKAFYRSLGVSLPGVTAWADTVRNAGKTMRDWSQLQPGDIVATGKPGDTPHVGVYTGDGNVFHQSRKRGLVAGNYPDLDEFKRGGYFVRPSVAPAPVAPTTTRASAAAAAPAPAAPRGGATGSQGRALVAAADKLGVSPLDLATIIGFETGGTYSPSKRGGAGGNYMGLIQFGPNERRQYGAHGGQSFEEQVQGPVVRYFQDRFANVGMSTKGADLLTLYRTVLGGNPKASLSGQDAFGTSPQSGVARMEPHRREAQRRFFGGGSPSSTTPSPAQPTQPYLDTTGPGLVGARGEVQVAELELRAAQEASKGAVEQAGKLRELINSGFLQDYGSEFREQTEAIIRSNEVTAARNALELEGARPELIDAAVRKAEAQQLYGSKVQGLTDALALLDKAGEGNSKTADTLREKLQGMGTDYANLTLQIDAAAKAQIAFNDAMRFRQDDRIGLGIREGAQQYVESIGTMREATAQLATQGIQGVEEALVQLATTGTANFKQFAAQMLADTARVIIQQLVLRSILNAIGGIGGGAGGAAASVVSSAAGSVTSGFAGIAGTIGGLIGPPGGSAKGNVLSGPAGGYQALLHGTEAVLPVRRGSDGNLGVMVTGGGGGGGSGSGGGGGGGTNNITINVDASGASAQGGQSSGRELAQVVPGVVQAIGGVNGRDGLQPFAMGGIVTSPTLFRYANGGVPGMGLMGEAGPEAIIPLRRGRDGKLGVTATGGSGGGTNNIKIYVDASGNSSVQGDQGSGRELAQVVAGVVQAEMVRQSRPGGILNRRN